MKGEKKMTMLKETREKVERAKEDFSRKWFTESDLYKVDPKTFHTIYPSLSTLKRYGLIENFSRKDELTVEDLVNLLNDFDDRDYYEIEDGKIFRIWNDDTLFRFK